MAINRILRKFGLEIRKHQPKSYQDIATVRTDEKRRGNVLLAYIVDPFLPSKDKVDPNRHTHFTEAVAIVRSFTSLGFDVDVIDYRNADFVPRKDYDIFVSARTNFVQLAERLNANCIKIAHLDTAHFLFNNTAAFSRLLDVQRRRKVALHSLKLIEKNWAPEHADYLAILGNDFTLGTYRYAGKKMFSLPVPTPNRYPSPESKDFNQISRNFLWLGSGGLVHKGLDLVLEAFAELPDYRLTVCGPVDAIFEKNFKRAYRAELYERDNINTVGWIDVGSDEFQDIVTNNTALIYPSASEGQSGAVITCMQAGLVPLVSRESGVDVKGFGVELGDCSIETIRQSVIELSGKPASELRDMALDAWGYARKHHTTDRYQEVCQEMIESIIGEARN